MNIVHGNRQGLALAGTAFGPADGRPVLFFHGGGQTRHAWGRAGEALGEAGFHAITYDLRGHGDSERSQDYQLVDFANDVFDLATAESRKPIIVGASLGGLSSLLANATEAGEISESLVLVDIAPRINPDGVDRILNFMSAHPRGFASLEEAADTVAAYQPHRAQRTDPEGLQKNLRRQADGRWYWHWDPALMGLFEQARRATLDPATFYRAADRLTQPILLVRGMLSDVVDDESTREFQDRLPHARVTEVGEAGHMVAGDRNDAFLEAVLEFLLGDAARACASAG
jgi:pimeloyl-ACP methyl ester carboxylesterase